MRRRAKCIYYKVVIRMHWEMTPSNRTCARYLHHICSVTFVLRLCIAENKVGGKWTCINRPGIHQDLVETKHAQSLNPHVFS